MSEDALDRLLDDYEHRIADRDAQESAEELSRASFNLDFDRWTADVAVPALEAVVAKLTARSHHADIETRAAGRWDPPHIRLHVVMRGLPARALTFEAGYRSTVISVVQGGTGLPSTGIGADSIQSMTTEKGQQLCFEVPADRAQSRMSPQVRPNSMGAVLPTQPTVDEVAARFAVLLPTRGECW